mmetsp:Transcript_37216/g.54542  ORF Transcript_37216/g.54542 Transcript_37216/m.54542 type:complete len:170 (-) Transcript_37216:240-749(-)
MNPPEKDNADPVIYEVERNNQQTALDISDLEDNEARDDFDSREVFEMIRHINDPEHPLTLEQLKVLTPENITVLDKANRVKVCFTPTIPHCSMATLIGLCIRVKLLRSLPSRFKVRVEITEGTHVSEQAVNKQLNDKERVAAALENSNLLGVVNKCVAKTDDSSLLCLD